MSNGKHKYQSWPGWMQVAFDIIWDQTGDDSAAYEAASNAIVDALRPGLVRAGVPEDALIEPSYAWYPDGSYRLNTLFDLPVPGSIIGSMMLHELDIQFHPADAWTGDARIETSVPKKTANEIRREVSQALRSYFDPNRHKPVTNPRRNRKSNQTRANPATTWRLVGDTASVLARHGIDRVDQLMSDEEAVLVDRVLEAEGSQARLLAVEYRVGRISPQYVLVELVLSAPEKRSELIATLARLPGWVVDQKSHGGRLSVRREYDFEIGRTPLEGC